MRDVKFIAKVWGSERVIADNGQYCGKRMELLRGHFSSVHFHKMKSETFYILRGRLLLELWNNDINSLTKHEMSVGSCMDILAGIVHRFSGISDCEFFEFSSAVIPSDVYRIVKGGQGDLPVVTTLEPNEAIESIGLS